MTESIQQMEHWENLRIQLINRIPSKRGEYSVGVSNNTSASTVFYTVTYNQCTICNQVIEWTRSVICYKCKLYITCHS